MSAHAILTPVIFIFGQIFLRNHFSTVALCDIDIRRCEIFLRVF